MTAGAESFRQVFDSIYWHSVQGFEQGALGRKLIVGGKLAIYWDISTEHLGKLWLAVRFNSGLAESTINHHGQQSLRFLYKTFRINL